MYSSHFHGNLLAPAFPAFNQYPPPTPIYSSPPQIFYWTGYPNGPLSPTAATYIQPLPLPPHAFHHFPDRPTLFAEMEMEQQQQQQQQSQEPTVAQIIPQQMPHQPNQFQTLPNQLKVTTNLNFQYDDNGNLGRVDFSKALCYQSQEVANNVVTKKVLMMHQKKTPILISSPNMPEHIEQEQMQQQQQQHFIDCNNNLSSPQIPCIETQTSTHLPPPPQIFTPKTTINPQFIHPPFLNHHLNWNPQFQ